MAITGKLTALKVAQAKRPGLYGDGGGLYLQVTKRGSKSWVFRFWIAERSPTTGELVGDPITIKVKGRAREMGLGSYITVYLAEARDQNSRMSQAPPKSVTQRRDVEFISAQGMSACGKSGHHDLAKSGRLLIDFVEKVGSCNS